MVDLLVGGITFCCDSLGSPCKKRTIGEFVMSEVKRYDSYVEYGVVHFASNPEGAWMPSDAVESELAALREELAQAESMRKFWADSAIELDKRLTAAEQRNAELVELLKKARRSIDPSCSGKALRMELDAALKPTESGASE